MKHHLNHIASRIYPIHLVNPLCNYLSQSVIDPEERSVRLRRWLAILCFQSLCMIFRHGIPQMQTMLTAKVKPGRADLDLLCSVCKAKMYLRVVLAPSSQRLSKQNAQQRSTLCIGHAKSLQVWSVTHLQPCSEKNCQASFLRGFRSWAAYPDCLEVLSCPDRVVLGKCRKSRKL